MEKTLLQISLILILFSCGEKGIEGFVGEKIIIAAKETEGKTDLDYTWILIEQPDGSLLNSSDLNPQTDKNKMNFVPDYPGTYSIDVVISQYGDEISSQSFLFNIVDIEDIINQKKDLASEDYKKNDKEKWLEEDLNQEELDKENYDEEYDDEEYDDEEYDDEEYDDEEYDDEEYDDEEYNDEEYNDEKYVKEKNSDPVPIIENSSKLSDRKIVSNNKTKMQLNRNASIPAKTDRFTIQVVSKKMLKDAELYAARLINKGYDAYIQRVIFEENDEIFYRVRIGSYDNINSAYATAKTVSRDLGMAAWVDFVREEQKP